MHGSDGDAQLIDGHGVDLGHDDAHGVIAGLLDAGDVGGRLAGLNTRRELAGAITQLGGQQLRDGGAGLLGVDAVVGQIVAILLNDGSPEILHGGVIRQSEAPVGSLGGHGVGLRVGAGSHEVVQDLLGKLHAGGVEGSPEGVVLILGVVIVGGVAVGAGSQDQLLTGGHAAAIGLHALDGLGVQGAVALVGGVAEDVHGEDDVIDGQGLTVRELQVIPEGEVIVDGAVGILGDLKVSGAVVGVVGSVVVDGLALDALVDDGAGTVRSQQAELSHNPDILVVGGLREEGRELAGEGCVADDQGSGVVSASAAAVAAACQQAEGHDEREQQCKSTFRVFHVFPPCFF